MLEAPRVVIIGAGIAGLTVARELSLRGIHVEIFEALSQIGGRVRTVKHGSRNYDLGASWFHEIGYNALYKVALDQKWKLHFDDAVFEFLDGAGAKCAPPSPQLIDPVALAAANSSNGSLSLKELAKLSGTPEVRLYEHWVGLPWDQISAEEALDFLGPAEEGDAENMRDAYNLSGNYRVIELLESQIDWQKAQLHLNEPVGSVSLQSKPHRYVIKTSQRTTFADAVVCTIPLGALRYSYAQLFSSLRLPQPLDRAIREGTMAALGKVVLEFDECFWDDGVDRFEVSTDPPVFFTNPYKGDNGPPTLVALVAPPLTQQIEANPQNAQTLLMPALKALSKSKQVPRATKVICTDWTENKFFGGSYSGLLIGQNYSSAVKPFTDGHGLLRFAGEHTTVEGVGCMHGAYGSGLREAEYLQKVFSSYQHKRGPKI